MPDDFYDPLIRYVRHQLDGGTDAAGTVEVQAYAAYVLALAGRPDRPAMSRLGELTAPASRAGATDDAQRCDGRLFLSAAWVLAGRHDLADALLPAAVPPVRTDRQHDGNLGSTVRDRAVMVLAVEQVQPDRADLPDLVQGLADLAHDGGWASTQDAAFASLAVGQYLRDRGRPPPPRRTRRPRCWPAGRCWRRRPTAGRWRGRARRPTGYPSGSTARPGVSATSAGCRPACRWRRRQPPRTALNVRRRYTTIDGHELRGDTVRSGDLIRVVVDLDGPAEMPNVVLEDLLPAGLEVENGRLATAARDDQPTSADDPPVFSGYADIRDDRVVIVGRIGSTGHARATYLARAVTPGMFVVPPVRAEAMYDLNVNGSTAAGRLTVTPPASRPMWPGPSEETGSRRLAGLVPRRQIWALHDPSRRMGPTAAPTVFRHVATTADRDGRVGHRTAGPVLRRVPVGRGFLALPAGAGPASTAVAGDRRSGWSATRRVRQPGRAVVRAADGRPGEPAPAGRHRRRGGRAVLRPRRRRLARRGRGGVAGPDVAVGPAWREHDRHAVGAPARADAAAGGRGASWRRPCGRARSSGGSRGRPCWSSTSTAPRSAAT